MQRVQRALLECQGRRQGKKAAYNDRLLGNHHSHTLRLLELLADTLRDNLLATNHGLGMDWVCNHVFCSALRMDSANCSCIFTQKRHLHIHHLKTRNASTDSREFLCIKNCYSKHTEKRAKKEEQTSYKNVATMFFVQLCAWIVQIV